MTLAARREQPIVSVCIPAYNSAAIIGETLESLQRQTFADFEVLVVDDCSTDDTEAVVRDFDDPRVRFVKNETNLGYARNVARCCELARGTYIYLLGNDDVLSPVALARTLAAFESDPSVTLVTRPYYWFESDDVRTPVRFIAPPDPSRDATIGIDADAKSFRAVIESLGQLSGLAFRRSAFVPDFDRYVFPAHVRPFLETWKRGKLVFLSDYVVAVRITSSQTRSIPQIYDPSPAWTWVCMLDEIFAAKRYDRQRRQGRAVIAGHPEGLVQIRCYAGYVRFLREAAILVRYHPANLVSWKFWFFALGLSVLPPSLARRLVDRYKPVWTAAPRRHIRLAQESAYRASSSAKIPA